MVGLVSVNVSPFANCLTADNSPVPFSAWAGSLILCLAAVLKVSRVPCDRLSTQASITALYAGQPSHGLQRTVSEGAIPDPCQSSFPSGRLCAEHGTVCLSRKNRWLSVKKSCVSTPAPCISRRSPRCPPRGRAGGPRVVPGPAGRAAGSRRSPPGLCRQSARRP